MSNNLPEELQLQNVNSLPNGRPNRRAFLVTVAKAAGVASVAGLAAWRPFVAFATPGTVTIVQFSDVGKPNGKVSVPKVVRSEAEWKQKLAPVSFDVARHAGTERAFTGSTWNNHDHGFYRCICCDNAVFS
jgi:peptide-methionine (R)-S-oxide reductase